MQTSATTETLTSLSEFRPTRTDRAAFVGMTGSGKTTLARYLLLGRKYRVVADYKGRIDWPEYELHKTFSSLRKSNAPALLYRPGYHEAIDADTRSQFWEWIYKRGGTTAYIDELTSITNRNLYPKDYGACLVRGRELGVEVWSATQRPTDIPQIALSESEHIYIFALSLPQDREKVESITGVPRDEISKLQKREFLYWRQSGGIVGPVKLRLLKPVG